MDYETALLLKPAIVGRLEKSLTGVLAAAAEKLKIEGEIDLAINGPDTDRTPQYWADCNPR